MLIADVQSSVIVVNEYHVENTGAVSAGHSTSHTIRRGLKTMNLNDFAYDCLEISKQRKDLEESSILDYLKHCSGEVLEAVDAYNYFRNVMPKVMSDMDLSIDDMVDKLKHEFSLELADIIICVLLCCAKEGIDIEQALIKAVEKNKERI